MNHAGQSGDGVFVSLYTKLVEIDDVQKARIVEVNIHVYSEVFMD